MRIGMIGCGHMGGAIAKALVSHGQKVFIANPHKPKNIKDAQWTAGNRTVAFSTDIIFIAVKPGVVQTVLKEIAPLLKPKQIIISIAAAVTLEKMQRWSGGHKKIVRVMPNLAAQVSESMSIWKALPSLSKKEKATVQKLLQLFGKTFEASHEKLIDTTSTVAGCGPAFVAAFLESMEQMLLKNGISKKDARMIALQTVHGTAHYFLQTETSFTDLKNAVQTKGGITEAAFKVLNKRQWQNIFEEAMKAAYARTLKIMHA